MSMSTSSGSIPASAIACWQAMTARSLVRTSSAAILRSSIPVFVVIHSSLVSTISAQSSLVMTSGGTYAPRPTMPTGAILLRIAQVRTFTVAASVVLDTDVHGLGEEAQAPPATLAPDPAVLDTAERYSQVPVQPSVDPDHPSLQCLRHPLATL